MAIRPSVIVLNHDSGPILVDCLEALLAQRFRDFELLLIDNASTDGSTHQAAASFGRDRRLRIVESERNLGCAGGRNLGMAKATGDVFCFVDSDAIAAPDWLDEVVRAFAKPSTGIVASKQVFARNPLLLNGLGGTLNAQGYGFDIAFGEPAEYARLPSAALFASGNGLCVRREVVEAVGAFDPAYFNYYEDVDLCLRAQRAGFELALAPGATLLHFLRSPEGRASAAKQMLCERNRIRTVLRHYPAGRLLRWLPRELSHEWRARRAGQCGGRTFLGAWRWNLLRTRSVVAFRLKWLRRPWTAPMRALVLRAWGYAPFKSHNASLVPSESRWSESVTMGADDDGKLLYGWYYAERTADGDTYRWSDDLAAVGLRSEKPVTRLKISYLHASPDTETLVSLVHAETGETWTAKLAPAPNVWTSAAERVELPAGSLRLILRTPAPSRERTGNRRALGVAVRDCEVV
jgi:GT2 family glycosyltransferase